MKMNRNYRNVLKGMLMTVLVVSLIIGSPSIQGFI